MTDIWFYLEFGYNVYYNCLIVFILIDEIETFIWSFKRWLDLTKSNKYLTHCFDGQIVLGMNNTNLYK